MLPSAFLIALKQSFPASQFYTDPADCWVYGYDNSRRHALPDAVFFAECTDDVAKIVRLCYEFSVPITARGRASGTTGGAVPVNGGIILSLERMQKILQIDKDNRLMVVEPGVLNSQVQEAAKPYGFFWGPNPTSAPYCTIGGNIACNAAGPRSLKYGATRDNVLGLNAVIGNGEVITCGSFTTKSSVGYDLTRLLIGSEGTLGVVTQATLKLLPLPAATCTLCLCFETMLQAAQAVVKIMQLSATPSGCEFMDQNAIRMIREHAGADLPLAAQGLLLVELEGTSTGLSDQIAELQNQLRDFALLEIKIATTTEETQRLWTIRKSLSQALRSLSPHKLNEDVIVPISHMPALLDYTQELAQQFAILIVNFGHAGNGNIHVNLLLDPHDPIQGPKAQACLNLLFDKVVALNGSISGEHGIGLEKKHYLKKEITPPTLQLMQRIKQQFDPKGILNPGKILEL